MNKCLLFTVLVLAYFTAASGAVCPSGAQYANCASCDSTPQCTTCNSGYGIAGNSGSQTCGACDPSCLNCALAANSTQCVNSNDLTQANNSAPQGCAVVNTTNTSTTVASYQTYSAGAFINNASTNVNTYSCFACPINCTNCTLTNGSKPQSAPLTCATCVNGTGFVSSNASSPYYGCFVNGTTAASTSGNTTTGTTTTGAGTTTTTTTRAATATCATNGTNGNCATCPSGYAPTTSSNTTICSACAAACANCLVANDATQCTNSNVTAYNNASSSTPCASYSTQNYLAGAVNTTNYTYTCYACVYNCTDCTLSNGSKPVAAITTSCKTCANGTSLQSGNYTLNGVNVTGTACVYNTFSTMKAGLTIGAIMTVLVSLLL